MKKLAVALFVALLGFAFTAPAFALENEFGGYFRVRMFNQTDFSGKDDNAADVQRADSRTRLYYTAKLNDNLKFVTKFEMDNVWGDDGYGDIGADGVSVEVKNTYMDFNLGMANIKMGTQGKSIQRGFLFDDDFSGIVLTADAFTGIYMKIDEDGDAVGDDDQAYHARYAFDLGGAKLTPNLTYVDQKDSDELYYVGLDIDGAAGGFGYWATLIYNGGEQGSDDVEAFLGAIGGNIAMNDAMDIHGQFFYATGDDDAADSDIENFVSMPGASYYWAEIMGYGIFDNQVSNGAPADKISNIMALNLGLSYKVSDKLKLGADLWYAVLAEDDVNGDDELGTEIDLSAKYTIIEGLSMDVVAAYLFADDATTNDASDDEDPFEIGTRFSISF